MATRKPIVIVGGVFREMPAGDAVPVAGGGTGSTTVAGARAVLGLDGGRNVVHNGCFRINQRSVTGTVTLAAGQYGHDRWRAGAAGCTYTFATSGGVTTITIGAGSLQQVIEGVDLQTDTYILSWAGTAQGKFGAGSYGLSGMSAPVTGGANLVLEFATGTLSNVQLEHGSARTPFETRSIAAEGALCRRFLRVAGRGSFLPVQVSGGSVLIVVPNDGMRASPSVGHNLTDANYVAAFPVGDQWALQVPNVANSVKTGTSSLSTAGLAGTAGVTGLIVVGATWSPAPVAIRFGETAFIELSAEL